MHAPLAFHLEISNVDPSLFFPGTGSGSFTHSIARTVGATGHVYSYEFHEARASTAAWVLHLFRIIAFAHSHSTSIHYLHVSSEEFARHGMSDIVTLTHRNVCKNGFTVTDTADSGTPLSLCFPPNGAQTDSPLVFLDLPAPWEAVEHAKVALRVRPPSHITPMTQLVHRIRFSEGPLDAYMLLQSLHRTSLAHRKRPQRSRLHGHVHQILNMSKWTILITE
jgi:tRNA methyltransferase complex GCD14 subunit